MSISQTHSPIPFLPHFFRVGFLASQLPQFCFIASLNFFRGYSIIFSILIFPLLFLDLLLPHLLPSIQRLIPFLPGEALLVDWAPPPSSS